MLLCQTGRQIMTGFELLTMVAVCCCETVQVDARLLPVVTLF